ncbi:MAG: microsomal dipeptidase-like Zn-dependent dipeptidase [Pseudohongiellaceae bacterium]|jgi:microsomal dipeptidase-like Zn-dependent dipeptidase
MTLTTVNRSATFKLTALSFFVALLAACGESAPETAMPDAAMEETSSQPSAPAAESEEELVARAQGIHERVITLDTHADINTGNFTFDTNYTMNLDTQVNLVKMEAGGLDVAFFIVYTGQGELNEAGYAAAYANAIDKFDAIHRLAEEIAPDEIELAYTSNDVRRIDAAGKKVAMIGIENAYPVGLEMSNIEDFHSRGGRYMSLAHNGHSQFADSQTGEADAEYLHDGLSELGREAVAEMNRLGIMVDISHPSIDAISQMLDISRAPVVASHSSARALTNHTRNLNDDLLQRVKENGGVVQTVAFGSYINEARRVFLQTGRAEIMERVAAELNFEALTEEQAAALNPVAALAYTTARQTMFRIANAEVNEVAPKATVSDFADHIDYIVDLIGLEHVGISSDFDGGGGIDGWNDASETFNVTVELVRRGYTEEELGMLWSGNLLRVLDDVQRIAGEIQAEA